MNGMPVFTWLVTIVPPPKMHLGGLQIGRDVDGVPEQTAAGLDRGPRRDLARIGAAATSTAAGDADDASWASASAFGATR